MTAPDRIWTSKCGRALVTDHPRWADDVEYIRADLATPAAMPPEVRALVEAGNKLAARAEWTDPHHDEARNEWTTALAALRAGGQQ